MVTGLLITVGAIVFLAVGIYLAMKSDKIADANNNNIPDVLETAFENLKAEAEVAAKTIKKVVKAVETEVEADVKKVAAEVKNVETKVEDTVKRLTKKPIKK